MNSPKIVGNLPTKSISDLIGFGVQAHALRWVPATSGNLSVRADDQHIAMTASGRHLGRLTDKDFVRVRLDNHYDGDLRPSAETGLHTMIYRQYEGAGAVLHTHSALATASSMRGGEHLLFEGYEVLKAFPGVSSHDVQRRLPIYRNDQNIERLSQLIEEQVIEQRGRQTELAESLPAFLIAGHGLYVWGSDVASAANQLEALEFLFECTQLLS